MGDVVPRAYAAAVVALRWPIVVAWVAVTVAAVVELAPLSERSAGALGTLVPANSRALEAEQASASAFGFPLYSRTILVRRDPGGLAASEQVRWGDAAARLTTEGDARVDEPGGEPTPVAGAIPLVNVPALAGVTPERDTTALAYLLFPPSVGPADRAEAAATLAAERFPGRAEVTGVVPARLAVTDIVVDRLRIVETATAVLVVLVVALHFRALAAPLATLAIVGVSYVSRSARSRGSPSATE